MTTSFELLQRGSGVLYGACVGIWVMTLFSPPTVDAMKLAEPALKTMKERHPKGFPTLTWVLPSAGYMMDGAARKAASEITRAFNDSFLALATIIEGKGFQAATVRAIVAGLDLAARSTSPRKVFAELAPAIAWLAPREAAVVEVLTSMRRSL